RASMSCFVQSQISTWKPSSAMRRTRSATGRSRKTISAQTARVNMRGLLYALTPKKVRARLLRHGKPVPLQRRALAGGQLVDVEVADQVHEQAVPVDVGVQVHEHRAQA